MSNEPGQHVEHEERHFAGAYVLGQLPAEQRAAYEAHLEGCGICRDAVEEVRPVARVLPHADPAQLDAPGPRPGLRDEILAAAGVRDDLALGRSRRQWSWSSAAAGLAAGAVAAAAVTIVAVPRDDARPVVRTISSPSPTPVDPLDRLRQPITVAFRAPGVDASANVVPHTWGTEVQVIGTGFRPGQTYRVDVIDDAGRVVGSGSFLGVSGRPIKCNLNAAVLRAAAASVLVRNDAGGLVLQANL